jgi:hypothetical protein
VKPVNLCGHDGCGNRAVFQATLILRGSPLKGASTIRVCEAHRLAGEAFILNDENRTRLAQLLVNENFCDAFIAHGMVKHNAAVEFEKIAS